MFPCDNTIYKEKYSADGEFKSVMFDRGCGATTDFNTQISLIKTVNDLEDEGGNILRISGHPEDNTLKIKWTSPQQLVIKGVTNQTIFHKAASYDSVSVHLADEGLNYSVIEKIRSE